MNVVSGTWKDSCNDDVGIGDWEESFGGGSWGVKAAQFLTARSFLLSGLQVRNGRFEGL